ncbi:hypothetical protein BaRGS_00037460, partial [Batillaria attramentaria]
VVDTPGFFVYESRELRELYRGLELLRPGPHAILYVIHLHWRFTPEDHDSYDHFRSILGEDITNYMIVVFTGGDMPRGTIEKLLSRAPESLRQVLSECGNRYVVFNNKADNKQPQVEQLLKMVRTLVNQNGGGFFKLERNDERGKCSVQ